MQPNIGGVRTTKPAEQLLSLLSADFPRRMAMFGFRGGESEDTVTRKKGYMRDAQQRWSCLTNYDLSTIKNEVQLTTIVKDRYSLSEAQAKSDVAAWMQGKQF
jgi:hypothetical protein